MSSPSGSIETRSGSSRYDASSSDRRERVPLGGGQHPAGTDGPVVHPLPVGALVEPFDGPRVDRPHPVQRCVGVLDPLPVEARRGQGPLQE